MTKEEFITWLKKEILMRGWSPAEFSRQSKISPAQVTRLLNGERWIGEKGLSSIAKALNYPADLVFEKAGFLPPNPELSPVKRKLAHLAKDLPDSEVEIAISLLEHLNREYRKTHPQTKPAK
jgi:transcriptional regulator with XRE-family HTH domain